MHSDAEISIIGKNPLWLKKLPNCLTLLRIFCAPLVVCFLAMGHGLVTPSLFPTTPPVLADILAGIIFTIAGITDFLDGWVARRYKIETNFGKLLDPLADKILVVSTLILLVESHKLWGWVAVVIIVRDLSINAIRLAAIDEGIDIASSKIGKWKTIFLDVGIVFLILYGRILFIPCSLVGYVLTFIAVILSLWSAFAYLWQYGNELYKRP